MTTPSQASRTPLLIPWGCGQPSLWVTLSSPTVRLELCTCSLSRGGFVMYLGAVASIPCMSKTPGIYQSILRSQPWWLHQGCSRSGPRTGREHQQGTLPQWQCKLPWCMLCFLVCSVTATNGARWDHFYNRNYVIMHSWCYLSTKLTSVPGNLCQQIGFCSMAALAGTHQMKTRLRYYSLNTQYTNSWATYTLRNNG